MILTKNLFSIFQISLFSITNFFSEILTRINELEKGNLDVSLIEPDHKYKRELYIAMELLRPVVTNNFIISPKIQMNNKKLGKDCLNKISITNELGIYGVLVQLVLN